MPRIADYAVIQDGSVTLPTAGGDIDLTFPSFNAPAVDVGSRSILGFRVNPSGTVTLRLTLNGTDVLIQTFDTDPQRSWHEIVEANLLKASSNTLTVTRTAGPGSVSVSDFFLMFQANT